MLHIILFVVTSDHSAHPLSYAENQLLQKGNWTLLHVPKKIVFLPVFMNGINCFCIHLIPPHKYLRYVHTVSAVSHCAPSNLSVPAFLSWLCHGWSLLSAHRHRKRTVDFLGCPCKIGKTYLLCKKALFWYFFIRSMAVFLGWGILVCGSVEVCIMIVFI